MNDHVQYISQLIQKSFREPLNAEEELALKQWLSTPANQEMYDQLRDAAFIEPELKKLFSYDKTAILDKILLAPVTITNQPAKISRLNYKWWAAAAASLFIGLGTWYYIAHQQPLSQVISKTNYASDVEPGHEGAILTLSDGSKITIDSLNNGLVTTQNGVNVTLQNGQLAYNYSGKSNNDVVYNTMSTPKGRSFKLKLPDGTSVWLNALSSIRYPVAFSEHERKVDITGEAYFEIAPDASSPFYVNINNKARLLVLGTSFNVNAYENEKTINATLLEGAVSIQHGNSAAIKLNPGQQAQISDRIQVVTLNETESDKIMAWKNGLFNFEGANLEQVMRQVERWYDIQVVYEKSIPDIQFFGEISRNIKLSELIDALKMSDVHFRIEKDRKLVVLP
ncbi:FecR family protein [Chitinophaga silvatica]|nr:FecR family protein [Chitinophaga silvatica]